MSRNSRYNTRGHTIVKHTRKKRRRNITKEFWNKEEYSAPFFVNRVPYSDIEKEQIKKQNKLIKKWKKSKKVKKKNKKQNRNYKGLSYAGLLKTPEWRKKKEQILIRDNRTCQICGFKIHLAVHHKKYRYKYPWLSPDKDLITLCELCHAKEHNK